MGKSGEYYKKLAEKNALETRMGKGSHVIIKGEAGRGYITVPLHRELDKGTECAIKKWFRAMGILTVIVLVIFALLVFI